MNPSRLFIERPVATTLLTFGLSLAGAVAFFMLPVSPLPQVDYPTIMVAANVPGASPRSRARGRADWAEATMTSATHHAPSTMPRPTFDTLAPSDVRS